MNKLIGYWLLLALLSLTVMSGCKDEEQDDNNNGGNNPGELAPGVARITGSAHDANGAPIANATVHIIYDLDGPGANAAPLVGSSVSFINTTQMLVTECGGDFPLSDGILVQIYWDNDANGPDADDPQPPLCSDPPNCDDGPARTVNYTSFPINGNALGAPGLFATTRNFVTIGEVLDPNIFYLRIFCTDNEILYQSNPITLPPGPSEQDVSFNCNQCEGIPVIPQWYLSAAYPDPVEDSVTINFGLEVAAQALLTVQYVGYEDSDTLRHASLPAGDYTFHADLPGFPNGLYEYVLRAGSYVNRRTFLLNTTNESRLRQQWPMAFSASDGSYRFDLAAGQTIEIRDQANQVDGQAVLNRVRVLAFQGTLRADTTFAIASQESVAVDLTLRP